MPLTAQTRRLPTAVAVALAVVLSGAVAVAARGEHSSRPRLATAVPAPTVHLPVPVVGAPSLTTAPSRPAAAPATSRANASGPTGAPAVSTSAAAVPAGRGQHPAPAGPAPATASAAGPLALPAGASSAASAAPLAAAPVVAAPVGAAPSCASGGATQPWPAGTPAFPEPPGAVMGTVSEQNDVTVVAFRTAEPLRSGVLWLLDAMPAAGYTLGRGDAESFEADAPFVGSGLHGILRLSARDACTTDWILAYTGTYTGGTAVASTPTASPLPFG